MAAVAVSLEERVLDRLLDPSDAALRARVLVDLLGYPERDPEVERARAGIPEQAWVRETLAAHHGDGTWGRGFYHKYDGTSWALLHLSEVGAPMDHPAIHAGVERLIDTARPIATLSGARALPFEDLDGGVFWSLPIACLTAHMALVLIRAGRADHAVTRGALAVARHRFEPDRGFGCFVMDDSLLPACVMTVPKVLKAFLALPPASRTAEDEALVRAMADVLLRFGLDRYVPEHAEAWRSRSRELGAADRSAEKRRWIAGGRLEPRREKAGWRRFSFPHSYNSDLLEVLLVLGKAGVERDEVVEAGLEVLVSKRRSDGMWAMVGGLGGKMHADLDRKGEASPWITYRALLALARFGALELP